MDTSGLDAVHDVSFPTRTRSFLWFGDLLINALQGIVGGLFPQTLMYFPEEEIGQHHHQAYGHTQTLIYFPKEEFGQHHRRAY